MEKEMGEKGDKRLKKKGKCTRARKIELENTPGGVVSFFSIFQKSQNGRRFDTKSQNALR